MTQARRWTPRWLIVLTLLASLVGSASGAGSTGWQTIRDPKGRFTLKLPPGWESEVFPDARPGEPVLSAHAPGAARSFPTIVVSVDNLPLSPKDSAEAAAPGLRAIFPDLAVVQEGSADVAGYPGYYRYMTGHPGNRAVLALYLVQLYVTTPKHGFILTGILLNDSPQLRPALPLVTQSLASLRPSE